MADWDGEQAHGEDVKMHEDVMQKALRGLSGKKGRGRTAQQGKKRGGKGFRGEWASRKEAEAGQHGEAKRTEG